MDADLDTLATALYVTSDDFLADNPQHRPWRPRVGLAPRLSDAELVTLVVLQALLGFTSEARFLRYAKASLRGMFPYLPTQSGYNKRIRAATGMLRAVIAYLAACTSSPAMMCGWSTRPRSSVGARGNGAALRPRRLGRVRLLRLASRFFWGLRLHLVCTLSGLPWRSRWPAPRPTNASAARHVRSRPESGCRAAEAEVDGGQELLREGVRSRARRRRVELLRPARKGEKPRPAHRYFKPFRQVIESINNTLKTQLDLERHGGRTIAGVASRVLQRILALTAAIWHNDQLGQPTLRSLTAYDH